MSVPSRTMKTLVEDPSVMWGWSWPGLARAKMASAAPCRWARDLANDAGKSISDLMWQRVQRQSSTTIAEPVASGASGDSGAMGNAISVTVGEGWAGRTKSRAAGPRVTCQ